MARRIEVQITGDTRDLERALGRAGAQTRTLGSTLGGLGKTAVLAGGAAGFGALALGLRAGFKEFAEGQRVAAQTNAVLKSTGEVAGVSAKGVDDLASSLLRKSGVDDEAIKSSENVLLTFTKIRNVGSSRIFDEATKSALDMSVALGTDLQSASIQVGKALNDPIKGVTALQRVGVSFTADQKEQIKTLVESGRVMDAQKLILHELATEFGGSAAAQGKTLTGQINIMKESFNNLLGDAIKPLIPYITQLTGWLQKQVDAWQKSGDAQQFFHDAAVKAREIAKGVGDAVAAAWPHIKQMAEWATKLAGALGGWDKVIEAAFGALILSKVLGLTSALIGTGGKGGLAGALSLVAKNWQISLTIVGAAAIGVVLAEVQKKLNEITGYGDPSKHPANVPSSSVSLGKNIYFDPASSKFTQTASNDPGISASIQAKNAARILGFPSEEALMKSVTSMVAKAKAVAGSQPLGPAFGPAKNLPGLQGGAAELAGFIQAHGGAITSGFRSKALQMQVNPSAPNSYHTRGEALDISPNAAIAKILYGLRGKLAELFIPTALPGGGLYHYGQQFENARLQAQHQDHIHAAYTGTATALAKILSGGPPVAADLTSAVAPTSGLAHAASKKATTGAAASVGLVTRGLSGSQQDNARLIFAIAKNKGLTDEEAAEVVAAAHAESGLSASSVNKSSKAAGLFQLLSPGYRQKAQSLGGLTDPKANTLAIIDDYVRYFRTHPFAKPGEAGRDVERSGEGAGFYAAALKSGTIGIGKGGFAGTPHEFDASYVEDAAAKRAALIAKAIQTAEERALKQLSEQPGRAGIISPDSVTKAVAAGRQFDQLAGQAAGALRQGLGSFAEIVGSDDDPSTTIDKLIATGKTKLDALTTALGSGMKGATTRALEELTKFKSSAAPALSAAFDSLRTGVTQGFATVLDSALKVFDAKTAAMLANVRATVTGFGFDIGQGEETPGEKVLRDFNDTQTALARAKRRQEAEAAGDTTTLAGLDVEDERTRLEAIAKAEREAANKALEDKKADVTQERAVERDAFEKSFNTLVENLRAGRITADEGQKQLTALLASYDITYKAVGDSLGQAFADAFNAQIDNAIAKVDVLLAKLAEAAALASGQGGAGESAAASSGSFGGARALGGPVLAGRTYEVGERGRELITLGDRGGYVTPLNDLIGDRSGGIQTVVIPVSLDGKVITEVVYDGLKRKSRQNAGLGLG